MYRALVFLLFCLFSSIAFADDAQLAREMGDRITRVPEFEFIREQAEKLGVRVYLFGGTAAAYAHYVKQNLAREAGDTRYPDFFYDYDYTNIFRSTQDLDVVVDGSSADAQKLEELLKAKFPHFMGDKAAQWEVRPLRKARGDKEAILNNPDFQNQHTDSHSTGLVEVTKAPAGESAVKDARDWQSKKPQFLKDVAEQKLHYYFNPLHETTKRAEQGMNPPILSAIRYLTKAFQYDLTISGEDRTRIEKIVREFDPRSIKNDYVAKWVEKNGKKLFQHAVDVDYAWETLEKLGLRDKLIALKNNSAVMDSLAWWMSKEPLRAKPLGEAGKTAAEIFGKDLVFAHETNSFLAFESITRSKGGELNAFISRQGGVGEYAIHGDGFYARHGRRGARDTGITVRMQLDPLAREGVDFLHPNKEYIVILNKAAVRVIPEQIQMSYIEYLKMLKAGKEFSSDDRALVEAFHRRVGRNGMSSPEEEKETIEFMTSEVRSRRPNLAVLREWFSLPKSAQYPELALEITKRKYLRAFLIDSVLTEPHWKNDVEVVRELLKDSSTHSELVTNVLVGEPWTKYPELIQQVVDAGKADDEIASELLAREYWAGHPEWWEKLLSRKKVDRDILWQAAASGEPRVIEKMLQNPEWDGVVASLALENKSSAAHPEWAMKILARSNNSFYVARAMGRAHWAGHPEIIRELIKVGDKSALEYMVKNLLTAPHWAPYEKEFVELLVAGGKVDEELLANVLLRPEWLERTDLFETIIKRGKATGQIPRLIISHPEKFSPELVMDVLRNDGNGMADRQIALGLLGKPEFAAYPQILEKIIENGFFNVDIAGQVMSLPQWAAHPEFIEALLKRKSHHVDVALLRTLSLPVWQDRPDLLQAVLQRSLPDSLVDQVISNNPYWQGVFAKLTGKNFAGAQDIKALFQGGFSFPTPTSKLKATCGGAFASLNP